MLWQVFCSVALSIAGEATVMALGTKVSYYILYKWAEATPNILSMEVDVELFLLWCLRV